MRNSSFIFIIIVSCVLLVVVISSCKKGLPLSCYDAVYNHKHKNDICTADCPGVLGCDGKNYCNVCSMHTNGIKKTK